MHLRYYRMDAAVSGAGRGAEC